MTAATISVTVTADAAGAAILRNVAASLCAAPPPSAVTAAAHPRIAGAQKPAVPEDFEETPPAGALPEPRKRGRPSNAAKAAKAAPAAEDDGFDEADTAGETGDGEESWGDDAEPAEATSLTLEGDILPAVQKAIAAHGTRDKVKAILAKFGAKAPKELDPSKFQAVLDALKKTK